MVTATTNYRPISRWQPRGMFYELRNPRRLIQALANTPVTIGFDSDLPPSTTSWTFAPPSHDSRVAIQFRSESDLVRLTGRWRLLANILHKRGMVDRRVRFRETLIHLGDGCTGDTPPNVFAFARRRGSQAGLIPNPFLLATQRRLPNALPWNSKTETVYFRGTTTGSSDYASNVRVALCKVAKTIPNADCGIAADEHTDTQFAKRVIQDDLFGSRQPLESMNRHKYLVDADGNSSSYDRYKFSGLFGGVPIRFESGWEECWHELLVDGVNCVQTDRYSLPDAVERLRSRPREAYEIAMAAQRVVKKHLLPETVREQLAHSLSRL